MSHHHELPHPVKGWEIPDPPYKCKYHNNPDKQPDPHVHAPRPAVKKIYNNVLEVIGNTPMVRLNKIPQAEGIKAEFLMKCEFFNPGGSLKDRVGYRMVADAEKQGRIKPGDTLVEPTSGNTGIGMALASIVHGYKNIFTLPEKMSEEKTDILSALGGQIIRRPTELDHDDPESYCGVAIQLAKKPNHHMLDQYSNASNALAHYDATAEEILEQCDNKVDYIFISAGTGGCLTGVGRKIKEKLPTCQIVAVDPYGSLQAVPGKINTAPGSYKVEGPGHDYIPLALDRKVADSWVKHNDQESFDFALRLIREEGLLVGGTTGSVLAGAIKWCKENNVPDTARCVLIGPDGIRNYLSKFVCEHWMVDNGFRSIEQYKEATHVLAGLPLLKELDHLKPVKLYDEKLTLGDALVALSEGAVVCPIIKDGQVFKILTATQVNKALCSGAAKPGDIAVWFGKKDFTIHDANTMDLNQLERALRRIPYLLLREKNEKGEVSNVYYVTQQDLMKATRKKLGL